MYLHYKHKTVLITYFIKYFIVLWVIIGLISSQSLNTMQYHTPEKTPIHHEATQLADDFVDPGSHVVVF